MSQGNQSSIAPPIDRPVEISTQVMPANTSTVPSQGRAGSTLIINYGGTFTPNSEKLRDNNWFAWKTRMSIVLRRYGVLEVVTGSMKKPEDFESAAAWDSRDLIAQELIAASIKDEQVIHISDCETSAEMWNNLRAVHEPVGVQFAIARKFYTTVASEGANIAKHVRKMKRLHDRLTLTDFPTNEVEFNSILVASLPPSWEAFTTSLLRFQATRFTSQQLVSILCGESMRRKEMMMQSQRKKLNCKICRGDCWRNPRMGGKVSKFVENIIMCRQSGHAPISED